MNNAFLIASITIIILTIIIAKKYLKDTKKLIPIILLGLTIALTVLVYPVCNKSNFIGKTVFSIVYSAQTIILNENLELIDSIAINQITDGIYVGIMYIISLLMPLLTVSFLLTLIGDIIAKIKIKFINKEQILIFSSVNEKSIAIAQKLSNKNNCIIFANYEKGQEKQLTQYIKNINYIKLNSSLEDIDINKFKSQYVNIYIFEDNEDTNLNLILKMIEKYKNTRHDIKLYPLLNEETSRIILDSTEKGNLQIEIVNEIERTILQLLQEKPLYLNTINNEISVLIVGCGKVGKQFLKIITWCGQIIGYDLKINVIDINANKIKANIIKECPELIDNYNYNFIEADITSYEAIEELNKLQNINYILVALDNDEKNIKEAIFLRRYFMWRDKISYNRKPIINIWIKDKEKNKQVDTLKNEKSVQYDLNAFGSTIDIYYKNPIINSTLERVSQQIHLLHDADDRKLRKYYEKEYNVKSSRATASHIKYKIYSMLKEKYTGNLETDLKLFEKILNDKRYFDMLVENEHNRWMAYMRSDGYITSTLEDVNKYKDTINNYTNHVIKMHPAIAEYSELDKIGESIGKKDLKKYDSDIIKNIPNILTRVEPKKEKKAKYTPQPIDVQDIVLDKELVEISEKLAKNVHEVWAQNRINDGWKYGKTRDDNKKEHPCIIPYEELSEAEKKYDRDTLQESLKLLIKMGYKIEKL